MILFQKSRPGGWRVPLSALAPGGSAFVCFQ